jgi:hypothetical protein
MNAAAHQEEVNLLGYLTWHSPKLLIQASIKLHCDEPASDPKRRARRSF